MSMQTYDKRSAQQPEQSSREAVQGSSSGVITGNQALLSILGGERHERRIPTDLRERILSRHKIDLSAARAYETPNLEAMTGEPAVTRGGEIFFQQGRFDPRTEGGRVMIMHEMMHIAQQGLGIVPGSGAVSGPSLEAAASAGTLGGISTAGFSMPASGAAAPVQGFFGLGGLGKLASKLNPFGRRQRQRPPVEKVGSGAVEKVVEGSQPVSSQSEILQESPPLTTEQISPDDTGGVSVQQPEKVETGPESVSEKVSEISEAKPEAKPKKPKKLDKIDEKIYETEKYFIPSPDSGVMKKLSDNLLSTDDYIKTLNTALSTDTDVTSPGSRKNKGKGRGNEGKEIYRGMDIKDRPELAELKYADFFTAGGKYAGLDNSLDKERGIGDKVEMTVHVNVPNVDYSEVKTKRFFKEKTSDFDPGLGRFKSANSRSLPHNATKEDVEAEKKRMGRLFNEKIKRAVILNMMQKRAVTRGFSRKELKALYEEAYMEMKRAKNNEKPTGLDHDVSELNKRGDSEEEQSKRAKVKEDMKLLSDVDTTGHAWVETKSKDADNQDRVRFTMGFINLKDSSNPIVAVPGKIKNPDPKDAKGGKYQTKKEVSKSKYLKALNFVLNFDDSKYTLAFQNCTSFAVQMAKAAGVAISGRTWLPFNFSMYSPDKTARTMTEASPEDQGKPYSGPEFSVVKDGESVSVTVGGETFTIPREAEEMPDNAMRELFLKCCAQKENYINIFDKLPAAKAEAYKAKLGGKILETFYKLDELQRMYVLRDLNEYKQSGEAPELLKMFAHREYDAAAGSMGISNARDVMDMERTTMVDNAERAVKKREPEKPSKRPTPTAKGLYSFITANNCAVWLQKAIDTAYKAKYRFGLKPDYMKPENAEKIAKSFALAFEKHVLSNKGDLEEIYVQFMSSEDMCTENGILEFVKKSTRLTTVGMALRNEFYAIAGKYLYNNKEGAVDKEYDELYF